MRECVAVAAICINYPNCISGFPDEQQYSLLCLPNETTSACASRNEILELRGVLTQSHAKTNHCIGARTRSPNHHHHPQTTSWLPKRGTHTANELSLHAFARACRERDRCQLCVRPSVVRVRWWSALALRINIVVVEQTHRTMRAHFGEIYSVKNAALAYNVKAQRHAPNYDQGDNPAHVL